VKHINTAWSKDKQEKATNIGPLTGKNTVKTGIASLVIKRRKKPMSETKVIKMITGETLITEMTDNGDTYTITDPHLIVPAQDNQIALVPWIPYSPSQFEGVEVCKEKVLMVMTPVEPLADEFKNATNGEMVTMGAPDEGVESDGPAGSGD